MFASETDSVNVNVQDAKTGTTSCSGYLLTQGRVSSDIVFPLMNEIIILKAALFIWFCFLSLILKSFDPKHLNMTNMQKQKPNNSEMKKGEVYIRTQPKL